ncbi:hypothetical protein TNCV_3966181 [Trichonephila clavipes]|nr:hypothetical protein TNCV_3966181 [Trichonephila clavipes]
MSRQALVKWDNSFDHGYTDIDEAESKKTPSTSTNSEVIVRAKEFIFTNRRITIDEISNEHDISHGVRSLMADRGTPQLDLPMGGVCVYRREIQYLPPINRQNSNIYGSGKFNFHQGHRQSKATRGLLATDHVNLNHGQVTWMTPELAPTSPNYYTTPKERRLSSFELSTDLACMAPLHGGSLVVLGSKS